MNKIRIIIDNNIDKLYHQYNQIKQLLPQHSLYIYKRSKSNIEEIVDYNIFFDIISEKALKLCPSKYNILLVNDEYVTNIQYLRRESFEDIPLIAIDNIINYYICLTKYSKNILEDKYKIIKSKILYFNGLTSDIYPKININISTKYILYDIDLYSGQNNVILLQTWLKYFTNRPEKLIILHRYYKDTIVLFNYELFKNGFYKNIILMKHQDITNFKIFASIINTSYYNLTTSIYENIFKDRIIITVKNDITQEILPNDFLMDKFDEINICKMLNKLFKYETLNINNKKVLLKNIKNTQIKINKLLNINNSDLIKNNEMVSVNDEDPQSNKAGIYNNRIIASHLEIKSKMDEIR